MENHEPDWQKILVAHGPAVWRTVYRILGRHADACDAYQEVFLDAVKFARNQPVTSWHGLLKRLATTRSIDLLRKKRQRDQEHTVSEVLDSFPGDGIDPAAATRGAEDLERIRRALLSLPPAQAEAFWLHHVEELDYEDLAKELGLESGNARVLVHRARKRLIRRLTTHDTETRDD